MHGLSHFLLLISRLILADAPESPVRLFEEEVFLEEGEAGGGPKHSYVIKGSDKCE